MSRKLTLTALATALLALALTGCHIQREAAHGTPTTPADPANPPTYYTTNFTCTTQDITANGQMRLQPDSVLWASVTKIIELGRARLTRDSVVVYVKMTNSCFRGNYIDLYHRFGYRTSFDEVVKMATADDAEQQIAALMKALSVDATVTMEPWKQVSALTFPLAIPKTVKPL